jgi:hypothetical protein
MELKIAFNPLVQSISKQLKSQGFKFDEDEAKNFESCRNGIFDLSINSLITDKQEAQIKAKLFKQIESHLKKKNNLKSVNKKS